jgi:hypothetical protein
MNKFQIVLQRLYNTIASSMALLRAVFGATMVGLLYCLPMSGPTAKAQEIEPRRWTHLPVGTNFVGAVYAHSEGDISLDPALRIEAAKTKMDTWAAGYIRTFNLLGKSARFDAYQAWQEGSWNGIVDGQARSITRKGWSDTFARFAVNFIGAPPLSGKEYLEYRASRKVDTVVGAALAVQLPTGDYMNDKLINLGSNRFTFRPQVGFSLIRGPWTLEINGASWIYTDNTSFFNGSTLEQDPLYTMQGHLIYTHKPGLWVSGSLGYGMGGQTTVNGIENDDHRADIRFALSAGIPVTRKFGLKASYIGSRKQETVGADTDVVAVGFTMFW